MIFDLISTKRITHRLREIGKMYGIAYGLPNKTKHKTNQFQQQMN